MSPEADFLGLVHNLGNALSEGTLTFWPRQKLCDKLGDLISNALGDNSCTPAEASKIRGVAGFMELGIFARIGRAGMGSLKQRQYVDQPPWTLS